MAESRLYDCAKVIRSKNSGPFEITLDVLFDNPIIYRKIKESNIINKRIIADLYHLEEDMITQIIFFDKALGFKVTFARKISSGTCYDTDVYGAQQHAPLSELIVNI